MAWTRVQATNTPPRPEPDGQAHRLIPNHGTTEEVADDARTVPADQGMAPRREALVQHDRITNFVKAALVLHHASA